MPRLLILSQLEGDRVFELSIDTTVIGRGEDAALVLSNISVSRHHAEVELNGETATIKDLGSANGTMLNGKVIQKAELSNGDEIMLGKYNLVFIADGPEGRFYKGRFVEYMVKYDADPRSFDDSTFAMSPAQIKQVQADATKARSARMTLAKNKNRFWHPEVQPLTFGDQGMVQVEGLFTGGVVADIGWDGKNHVLTKQGRLLKVLVNDQPITCRALRSGDNVRIGNTTFIYEIQSPS
jgi:pSer/pThr/pTyr-binding forkhead associated (FHA) protein